MRYLFSVSLPRSGHHTVEMVLSKLLHERFSYCEFYTIAECCRDIPCAKLADRAKSGACVFVQKSHDRALTDPVPDCADAVLVQIREPVARILSNYELGLKPRPPGTHCASYQEFWTAREVSYTSGFATKWLNASVEKRLILRYEELVNEPERYFSKIFDVAGLVDDAPEPSVIRELLKHRAASDGAPFQAREISTSKYMDQDLMDQVVYVLMRDFDNMGYAVPEGIAPRAPGERFAALLAAFDAEQIGAVEKALDAFREYSLMDGSHLLAHEWLGHLCVRAKRFEEASVHFERIVDATGGDEGSLLGMASVEISRGNGAEAMAFAERALDRTISPARAVRFIATNFPGTDLERRARAECGPIMLAREDVVVLFRAILGRDPEDERWVERLRGAEDLAAVRRSLLISPEFGVLYRALKSEGSRSG